jgi:hypothetical protein
VDGTDVGGGVQVSDPLDRFERQAEQVADDVVSGRTATPDTAGATAGGGVAVQRDEEEGEEAEESRLPVQREDSEEEEKENEE